MQRRDFLKTSAALGTAAMAARRSNAAAENDAESAQLPPRKSSSQWRVIMNDDGWNQFGGNTTADHLRQRVDYIAKAGVDVLTWCSAAPELCLYPTQVGEWQGSPDRAAKLTTGHAWNIAYNLRQLVEQGSDPLEVIASRCHQHGMPFVTSIRMNDTHYTQGYSSAHVVTEFTLEHPDWCIRDAAGKIAGGMNYAIPQVREHRLAIMREQVENYDLDGLELDFMRHAPFFPRERAGQDAPLMTRFIGEIRQMIDEVARQKNRARPILGVRVPTTLAECATEGLALDDWLAEGLPDYICPSHRSRPDFNIPVEEFVRIASGTPCRIFPTVHQSLLAQYDKEQVMTLEKYRGFANNMFQFGADGISTFNFMMGDIGTWHIQRHIGAWTMMKEMHDPEALQDHDRAYGYDISSDREISLDRGQDVGRRRTIPFRVAEDFSDNSWKRALRFKPGDLSVADRLRFDINGTDVTDRLRGDFVLEMSDPPNSARYQIDLAGSPVRFGDNEFGATLIEANPDLQAWTPDYLGYEQTLNVGPIRFTELEIVVTKA
jgi:hypothetical protein